MGENVKVSKNLGLVIRACHRGGEFEAIRQCVSLHFSQDRFWSGAVPG